MIADKAVAGIPTLTKSCRLSYRLNRAIMTPDWLVTWPALLDFPRCTKLAAADYALVPIMEPAQLSHKRVALCDVEEVMKPFQRLKGHISFSEVAHAFECDFSQSAVDCS